MSSLWTPSGERPVPPPTRHADERPRDPGAEAHRPGAPSRARPREAAPDGRRSGGAETEDPEAAEAEVAALRDALARTPAAAVVANHCYGLFELAALHLSSQPPHLGDAQLAIDGLAGLVETLRGRLGPDEPTLVDGLAQLRLAWVQVKAAHDNQPAAPGHA